MLTFDFCISMVQMTPPAAGLCLDVYRFLKNAHNICLLSMFVCIQLVQVIINTTHLEQSCHFLEEFISNITNVPPDTVNATKLYGTSTFKVHRHTQLFPCLIYVLVASLVFLFFYSVISTCFFTLMYTNKLYLFYLYALYLFICPVNTKHYLFCSQLHYVFSTVLMLT